MGGYVCSPCMDLWAEGRKNIFRGRLSRSNALFCLLYECTIWNSGIQLSVVHGRDSCQCFDSCCVLSVQRGNEIEIYGLSYFDSFFNSRCSVCR